MTQNDIRPDLGLRPIINVSGTMTSLGASIVVPEAVATVSAILPQFVEIGDLQKKASRTIARLCGTEAGFVTASCSAGITLAVAGAMTGCDLAAVERLPDTDRLKNEVLIMTGHMVGYGAPVEQGIRLSGAKVVPVGQATSAHGYQLNGAINDRTAAAVYVVSHHTVQYGQIPLKEFVEICHARGVPVIVDAASEYDLKGFLATGADIALYFVPQVPRRPDRRHRGGPDRARSRDLHAEHGHRSRHEDRQGGHSRHHCCAGGLGEAGPCGGARTRDALSRTLGADAFGPPRRDPIREADPTNNPLDRLKVAIEPKGAHITAWDLADALAAGQTPIIVRDHEVEHGYFISTPAISIPDRKRSWQSGSSRNWTRRDGRTRSSHPLSIPGAIALRGPSCAGPSSAGDEERVALPQPVTRSPRP